MPAKTKDEMIASIERIANTVVQAAGLELFDVELKGSGRSHYLRVYIDRPGKPAVPDQAEGVTLEDCENVSREMSALLDAEDPIPGTYSLEVSSPGVERPLKRWKDWERFVGQDGLTIGLVLALLARVPRTHSAVATIAPSGSPDRDE